MLAIKLDARLCSHARPMHSHEPIGRAATNPPGSSRCANQKGEVAAISDLCAASPHFVIHDLVVRLERAQEFAEPGVLPEGCRVGARSLRIALRAEARRGARSGDVPCVRPNALVNPMTRKVSGVADDEYIAAVLSVHPTGLG
jgi:hypothetical protein